MTFKWPLLRSSIAWRRRTTGPGTPWKRTSIRNPGDTSYPDLLQVGSNHSSKFVSKQASKLVNDARGAATKKYIVPLRSFDKVVMPYVKPVADQKNWKGETQCISPSSFIANAYNELYAFFTGKGSFLKFWANRIGRPSPLNPPLSEISLWNSTLFRT